MTNVSFEQQITFRGDQQFLPPNTRALAHDDSNTRALDGSSAHAPPNTRAHAPPNTRAPPDTHDGSSPLAMSSIVAPQDMDLLDASRAPGAWRPGATKNSKKNAEAKAKAKAKAKAW